MADGIEIMSKLDSYIVTIFLVVRDARISLSLLDVL